MAAYAFAIFTGAFLLFQVQPLMGKYLLPWFGGAPGVWTTCILFFQVVLLAGYLYAHLSTRLLKPRTQIVLHLALIGAALVALPIVPSESWEPQTAADPTIRVLTLLAACVGLPYFVLSATAPLLQHWFARSHPGASPFRLYALSNAGSLLALLSYPVVFETWLTRHSQAAIWGAGLALYALACGFCAARLWQNPNAVSLADTPEVTRSENSPTARAPKARARQETARATPSTTSHKILWLSLPACASVLLLAVTNKICQDLAPVPLLWLLPLSVYLASFIVCFERPNWYVRYAFGPALALALAAMVCMLAERFAPPTPLQVLIYAAGLFVCCMVCHGEVYRLKPSPEHLTAFYLLVAAGGALGGLFVAVLAPIMFPDYFELHWGMILCGTLFLIVCARGRARPLRPWHAATWTGSWLALAILAWLLWGSIHKYASVRAYRARNFYGVLNVYRHQFPDPSLSLVELVHGRIAHGMQFLHPARARQPTLYYSEGSGIGHAFRALAFPNRRIGVVGLGAGTLAAYGRAGDQIRFYEINPEVQKVAESFFTFLKNSAAATSIVLGDARLSLEREAPQNFDLLVLDAFNSDSIPTHLLTREAFESYERHLKPNALIAVHISNASLNLEPVVARVADGSGYVARVLQQAEANEAQGVLPSTWVLLARSAAHQALSAGRPAAALASSAPLWTDEYSGLFRLLRWHELVSSPHPVVAQRPDNTRNEVRTTAGMSQQDIATAIMGFREAVKRDPASSVALNNLACLLATAPDAALRDGAEAVKCAEQACTLTGYSNAATVTTLAAAYAEAGRFADAVAAAEKSCKLAAANADPVLLQRNMELLELYRRKQPFHQPAR
jgi:hypothetical protein